MTNKKKCKFKMIDGRPNRVGGAASRAAISVHHEFAGSG